MTLPGLTSPSPPGAPTTGAPAPSAGMISPSSTPGHLALIPDLGTTLILANGLTI